MKERIVTFHLKYLFMFIGSRNYFKEIDVSYNYYNAIIVSLIIVTM